MLRELALPVFDAQTLPGSSFSYSFDPGEGRARVQVVHQRPRSAPSRSLFIADMEDMAHEVRMADSRRATNAWLRERGLTEIRDNGIYNDLASAVVVHGNWIADGTSFTNSVTENTVAISPQFAGSGAAIESTTTSPEAAGGFWYQGRAIRIFWEPVISSAASSPGNLTLNWRLNSHTGNSFGAGPASALAVSMATVSWISRLHAVCRTVGAAGALEGSTEYRYVLSATQLTATTDMINRASATIDTTANNNIVGTALFSAASASNIILTKMLVVEVLS